MGEYIPVQTTRVPASWGERYDLAYDRYYSPYCPSLPRQYPRSTSSSRYVPVPSFLLNIEVHCSLQRPASSSTAEKRSDAGSRLPEYFTKRRGLSADEGDGDHVRIDVERDGGREERVNRVDITARPHHQRVFVKSQSSPQMVTVDKSRRVV